MITRYQNSQIEAIWKEQNVLELWKNIEIWVAEGFAQGGTISSTELMEIQKTKVNTLHFRQLEQQSKHELGAFVDMLASQSQSGGRWIHYGLTSNDVLDTAQHYLLKKTNDFIAQQLTEILQILRTKAFAEKETLMIGRTHGMYAEPITVGYKFALWFAELQRQKERLTNAGEEINFCKIAGPTGLRPNVPFAVNEYVAKKLKMKVDHAVNQLILRDRLVHFFHAWSGLSVTIEKIATEIRNLQRDGINELQEPFAPQQKGSSAMPHKINPYLSENICGLMRTLRSFMTAIWSTNLGWHERDLTNSSIERLVLKDSSHLLANGLQKLKFVLQGLKISHVHIENNLQAGWSSFISHQLLILLLSKKNISRTQAYKAVQEMLGEKNLSQKDLQARTQNHPIFDCLTDADWARLFDRQTYRAKVNDLFAQIFSSPTNNE